MDNMHVGYVFEQKLHPKKSQRNHSEKMHFHSFFKHKLHPEDTPKPSRIGTECTFTFFLMQKKKLKPTGKKTTCTFTAFCSATVDSEGGHPHLEPWTSTPQHKLHFYDCFTLKMAICTTEHGHPHRRKWHPLALLGSLGVPRPS